MSKVTALQLTIFLGFTTALILLFIQILVLWPSFRLDAFRQSLFALRDELFDYAADGHISFDDPAYGLLRKSMNGFIRYAHNLTFFRLLVTIWGWRIAEPANTFDWAESWNLALERVKDQHAKEKLVEFHEKTMLLVMARIFTGSPVLIAAVIVTSFVTAIHSKWTSAKQLCLHAASELGAKIFDPRILEEEAARAAV
jgi:hypothetical protein